MKKLLPLFLLASMFYGVWAQDKGQPRSKHQNMCYGIESLIDDLTPIQKRKLERLSAQTKKNIGTLKDQHSRLRDSISFLLQQTASDAIARELYPMFEREAKLNAKIQKEYYKTRLAIDGILTDEQAQYLTQKLKEERQKKHKSHKTSK